MCRHTFSAKTMSLVISLLKTKIRVKCLHELANRDWYSFYYYYYYLFYLFLFVCLCFDLTTTLTRLKQVHVRSKFATLKKIARARIHLTLRYFFFFFFFFLKWKKKKKKKKNEFACMDAQFFYPALVGYVSTLQWSISLIWTIWKSNVSPIQLDDESSCLK